MPRDPARSPACEPASAQAAYGRLGVARVVPPVRIEARRFRPGRLARQPDRDAVAEDDDARLPARLLDDLRHPVVELVAVLEDDLRTSGRLDVLRPRLVLVRVGVRLE